MRTLSRSLVFALLGPLIVFVNVAFPQQQQVLRFRLEPLCNKITLAMSLSSSPSVIPIAGWDDNCGEEPKAPIYGTLVVLPNGGLSIGYTTALPYSIYGFENFDLHTTVEWPPTSNVGSWRDDLGDSGSFVFDILDQPSG
jgi:hypothetical protein